MNGTLSRMTSSGVTPGPYSPKFSPYIIGKLLTTDINDFRAMAQKSISSRIIAQCTLVAL